MTEVSHRGEAQLWTHRGTKANKQLLIQRKQEPQWNNLVLSLKPGAVVRTNDSQGYITIHFTTGDIYHSVWKGSGVILCDLLPTLSLNTRQPFCNFTRCQQRHPL